MINEDRICFGENCQNRLTLEDSLFQSQADQNEFRKPVFGRSPCQVDSESSSQ